MSTWRIPAALALVVRLGGQTPAETSEWMNRGRAAITAGQREKAAAAFGKACEFAPKDADACYFFGRTLQTLDRFEEARKPLEQALANAASTHLARTHRAVALNYLGLAMPEQAERHFLAAIRHGPAGGGQDDPRIDYGAFLIRQARAAEAVRVLEKARDANGNSPRVHAEIGKALLDLGKAAEAAKSLEHAVALSPTNWTDRLALARAYQQLGRVEDAERELSIARKGWAAQNPDLISK